MNMELDLHNIPRALVNGIEIDAIAGDDIQSIEPFTGEVLWSSLNSDKNILDNAIQCARKAFNGWALTPIENRIAIARNFAKLTQNNKDMLANLIAKEAGKPIWEALLEVKSLTNKLEASIEAYSKRCSQSDRMINGLRSVTRFKPHGVIAVLGPYNFPLSMANGHIMPALIAGNCVVFKPSELTSLCGIVMTRLWQEAGLPDGVINCVAGDAQLAKQLVNSPEVDGIYFTGGREAGLSVLNQSALKPEKIVAVEMGGNNPLLIEDYNPDNVSAVLSIILHSAFATSGQRCSCARRLFVNTKVAAHLIPLLKNAAKGLQIGHYKNSPEPFYGPIIRPQSVSRTQDHIENLIKAGARYILEPEISGPINTIMSPCLLDVGKVTKHLDEELFGPVLKIDTYDSLEDGIAKASDTLYGLSAGIVTEDPGKYLDFSNAIKAGVINWNQDITGATAFAPFGGLKQSGNHRPAGYLSADYCSYSTASFEVEPKDMKVPNTPGLGLKD